MVRFGRAISVLMVACGLLSAETRFGLPVAALEKPKRLRAVELTGNKFALAQKGDLAVAAVVYGGPERYFVDVAVSNRRTSAVTLADDFVRFHKNGSSVPYRDTLAVAAQLRDVAARPAPRVAAAKVTPANFKQQAAVEQQRALIEKGKEMERAFATHVAAFAHERQSLHLGPGKMTLYTYVFEPDDRDVLPFELCIVAGDEEFLFEYKK